MPPEPSIARVLPEEFSGPRILLRPYRSGDGPALHAAVNEDREHLRRWLPWTGEHASPEASEDAARRLRARWDRREDLIVGIWERNGRLLGGSGLHRINWDVPSFEIGYWLRRSAQGQGYVTEAVELLCRFAFETLGAERVVIRSAHENVRSAAVPRRLEFTPEDVPGDTLVFTLTAADYAHRSSQPQRS